MLFWELGNRIETPSLQAVNAIRVPNWSCCVNRQKIFSKK